MTDNELKGIREHMERCYAGLNDSAFDDVVCLIAHIDYLQTALDAANKRAEAAIADINLLDTRGWLCKYRDGGACIKDSARQICTYGTCSANACKEKIWRGPQDNENMV